MEIFSKVACNLSIMIMGHKMLVVGKMPCSPLQGCLFSNSPKSKNTSNDKMDFAKVKEKLS